MRPIVRSMLVETNLIPAAQPAGDFFTFPDIAELRNGVVIFGVEVYTTDELAVGVSGSPGISAVDATGCVLTLQQLSTQRIKEIPLLSLVSQSNAGIWKELSGFLVNWQASGVRTTNLMAAGAAFRVAASIFYLRLEDLTPQQRSIMLAANQSQPAFGSRVSQQAQTARTQRRTF